MTEDRNNLIGREFVHFKGGHYRLECFAKDSETLEEMVVYRALYGEGGLWVRPARMFFESIERAGKTMKRFHCRPIRTKHDFMTPYKTSFSNESMSYLLSA